MLNKFISFTAILFLLIFPIYILPVKIPSLDFDKQIVLVVFSLLFLLLFTLKLATGKKIVIKRTPIDLLLMGLVLFSVLSVLLSSPNKISSFLSPGGPVTLFALAILYCVFARISVSLFPFVISSVVVALIVLLGETGIIPSLSTFSPVGNSFTAFTFLATVAIYMGSDALISLFSPRLHKHIKSIIVIIALKFLPLLIVLSAAGVSAFHLFTDRKPILLPFAYGWPIMMEAFKNFQNFIFGIGPNNFASIFTLGKPAGINLTPYWNLMSTTSSSFLLNLTTESGIIAVFFFALIILKSLRRQSDQKARSCFPPFLTAAILLILFPGNIMLLTVFFVFLALSSPKSDYNLPFNNHRLAVYFSFLVVLISLTASYFSGKTYLGNFFYRQAIRQLADQKLENAYFLSQKALKLDPYSEYNYLLSSSLALTTAQNLSQSKNATESAGKISFYAQQSIDLSRMAVNLNPQDSRNWEQLVMVYSSLVGTVKDAEKFALDAYSRQLVLDPNSPVVKVRAGEFLMNLQQYDDAQNLFIQAINLKPDWNISHYDLGILLAQNKRYPEAEVQLQKTLELTSENSKDYKLIQNQLEQVKKLVPKEATPEAKSR